MGEPLLPIRCQPVRSTGAAPLLYSSIHWWSADAAVPIHATSLITTAGGVGTGGGVTRGVGVSVRVAVGVGVWVRVGVGVGV